MSNVSTTRAGIRDNHTVRAFVSRVLFVFFLVALITFFVLPMLWLFTAPFDATPTLAVAVPDWTFDNFREMAENPFALPSIVNSLILSGGTVLIVLLAGAPAAYVLSRARFRGRDTTLYILLLFSSIVTGSAAMVPLFFIALQLGLIDTYHGTIVILAGGLLPASIFILKDFTDTIPRSYEESARVFGANSFQMLRDVVAPVIRPGLAVIAVWAFVNVWSNFLLPFILLRTPSKSPAAVVMYSFYTEGGQAVIRVIAAFSIVYTIPVLLAYLFVNRRYGFRFYGGIKG